MYKAIFPDGSIIEKNSLKNVIHEAVSILRWCRRMIPYDTRCDFVIIDDHEGKNIGVIDISKLGIILCRRPLPGQDEFIATWLSMEGERSQC